MPGGTQAVTIVEEGVAFAPECHCPEDTLVPIGVSQKPVHHRACGRRPEIGSALILAPLCSLQWVERRCMAVSSGIAPPLSLMIGRQPGDRLTPSQSELFQDLPFSTT